MYNEPDWSSLTLPELLEKAHTLSEKAYSSDMSTYAFLDRVLDRLLPGSELGAEIAELVKKAQEVNKVLAELQRDISEINVPASDPSTLS